MGIFLPKTTRFWRKRLWLGLCLIIFTWGSSPGFAAMLCEPEQASSLHFSPGSFLRYKPPLTVHPHAAKCNGYKCHSRHLRQTISVHQSAKQSAALGLGPYPRATGSWRVKADLFLSFLQKTGTNKLTGAGFNAWRLHDLCGFEPLFSLHPHMLCINVCLCVKSNLVWYLLRGEVGSHLYVSAERQAHQWHCINNSDHK